MYYIGIDGGGTKTEGVLCNEKGQVLARRVTGGSNPNDIGISEAAQLFGALALVLCTDATVSPDEVCLFAGGSGCGVADTAEQIKGILQAQLPHASVGSDIVNVAEAGLGDEKGLAVIAGTGSAFFAWDGETTRLFGGDGYLFEGAGSGFSLARDGIGAALREEDGYPESVTMITQLLQQRLGKRVKASLGDFYRGGKSYIASFAPVVFEAAKQGDRTAQMLVEMHASYIAHTVEKLLGCTELPARVAFSGGLFQNSAFFKTV